MMIKNAVIIFLCSSILMNPLSAEYPNYSNIEDQYTKRKLFKFRTVRKVFRKIRKLRKVKKIKVDEASSLIQGMRKLVRQTTGIKVSNEKIKKHLYKVVRKIDPLVDVSIFDQLFNDYHRRGLNGENREIAANIPLGGVAIACSFLIGMIPLGFPPAAVICYPAAQVLFTSGTGMILYGLKEQDEINKLRKSLTNIEQIPFPDIDFESIEGEMEVNEPLKLPDDKINKRVDLFFNAVDLEETELDFLKDKGLLDPDMYEKFSSNIASKMLIASD